VRAPAGAWHRLIGTRAGRHRRPRHAPRTGRLAAGRCAQRAGRCSARCSAPVRLRARPHLPFPHGDRRAGDCRASLAARRPVISWHLHSDCITDPAHNPSDDEPGQTRCSSRRRLMWHPHEALPRPPVASPHGGWITGLAAAACGYFAAPVDRSSPATLRDSLSQRLSTFPHPRLSTAMHRLTSVFG
jgi:hypothetical protein